MSMVMSLLRRGLEAAVARRARDVSAMSQTAEQDSERAGAVRCSRAVRAGKRQTSQKLQHDCVHCWHTCRACFLPAHVGEHAAMAWWLWPAGARRRADAPWATQGGRATRNTQGDTGGEGSLAERA
jgi:hypothetical protein